MNQLAPLSSTFPVPILVAAAGDKASKRFLEFFAATIRNTRTRRALRPRLNGVSGVGSPARP